MEAVDILMVVCVIVFLVVAAFLTIKRVSDNERVTRILAVPKAGKPVKGKRNYTKRSTYWSGERKKKANKKA
jgi:hypothetical protein